MDLPSGQSKSNSDGTDANHAGGKSNCAGVGCT